jgi:hypothetical protein
MGCNGRHSEMNARDSEAKRPRELGRRRGEGLSWAGDKRTPRPGWRSLAVPVEDRCQRQRAAGQGR